MSTRDEYVAKLKTQLDEWSSEIGVLEEKARDVKAEALVKYQEQLSALRVKRDEGEAKLEEIKAAGESSWEQLKIETENVWQAFKDSALAFQAHFK